MELDGNSSLPGRGPANKAKLNGVRTGKSAIQIVGRVEGLATRAYQQVARQQGRSVGGSARH